MYQELKVRVAYGPWRDEVGILFEIVGYDGRRGIVQPVDFIVKTIEEGAVVEPTFHLNKETAKNLLEALKGLGIKTEDQSKVEGMLEATKYHLEDMRQINGLERKEN